MPADGTLAAISPRWFRQPLRQLLSRIYLLPCARKGRVSAFGPTRTDGHALCQPKWPQAPVGWRRALNRASAAPGGTRRAREAPRMVFMGGPLFRDKVSLDSRGVEGLMPLLKSGHLKS